MRIRTFWHATVVAFALGALSSPAAEPGVGPATIVIGQSAAFSGGAAAESREANLGARAYFDAVNAQGGVHGRKIVLESLDDGFDPRRTLANTRILLDEKKAFALFLYRGTPTTEAILPLISASRVPLIAPATGAQSLRQPMNRYVFNIRANYHEEAAALVGQLATLKLSRVAIFHSNDSYGKDAIAGLSPALKAEGIEPVAVAAYERNTLDVEPAAKKILAATPQAIVMIGTSRACKAFIDEVKKAGSNAQLFALSDVSSQAFLKDIGASGRGLAITEVMPFPWDNRSPLVKAYQATLANSPQAPISYSSLEGYVAARVLVEGLRRAGPALTRDKLIGAFESMKSFDLGGFAIDFSPASHAGSKFVELAVVGADGNLRR